MLYLSLIISILLINYLNSTLIVHLNDDNNLKTPIRRVKYCKNCKTPVNGGSYFYGLNAYHGIKKYRLTGELVLSLPNYLDGVKALNKEIIQDRIVLVNRGRSGISTKVKQALDAGAKAVLIADDGQCDEEFSFCGTQTGSVKDGGFAIYDSMSTWSNINIPVLLITLNTANRIRNEMTIYKESKKRHGDYQNITILDYEWDGAIDSEEL